MFVEQNRTAADFFADLANAGEPRPLTDSIGFVGRQEELALIDSELTALAALPRDADRTIMSYWYAAPGTGLTTLLTEAIRRHAPDPNDINGLYLDCRLLVQGPDHGIDQMIQALERQLQKPHNGPIVAAIDHIDALDWKRETAFKVSLIAINGG